VLEAALERAPSPLPEKDEPKADAVLVAPQAATTLAEVVKH
jgi:hypothetical protein